MNFFPSDFEFSFSAQFRDLLTYDDVIDVLICMSSIKFYRVFQYKHFEVWLVVLCFTVLKIMTIFLSHTPKLSSRLSSERRTLWRHFWSYCRVTKSLPSVFCYARWSSSWKWREIRAHFFAHGDPLSDWTTAAISCSYRDIGVPCSVVDRAFSVAGPAAWNSLPDCLRDPSRSFDSFTETWKRFAIWIYTADIDTDNWHNSLVTLKLQMA